MKIYTTYSKLGFDSVTNSGFQVIIASGRRVFKTREVADNNTGPGRIVYMADVEEDSVEWETDDEGILTNSTILYEGDDLDG